MSDNNETTAIITTEEPAVAAVITTEEPAVAATLDELRYLVFEGKAGDTPDIQIGTVTTLDPGSNATASITGTAEEPVLNLGIPRGTPGESAPQESVLYTEQTLTEAQKAQARENIGAGTYIKPSGGIPASDLASGVIPTVPEMATQADMSDWTSGKAVDAATLKTDFMAAALELDDLSVNKADKTEIPTKTSDLTNDSGYQTAQQVQTAIAAAAELPPVTSTDNGKVLAVNNGEWSADSPVIVSGTDAQVANAVNDYLTQYGVPLRLSEEIKQALLDCFENVAWINDQGQTYYDALYAALYPPVDVLSISAVFTQGSAVIYDTDSLDTLKQYLVVTATMTDSTTQTVTDYTLSGTLTVGTSTITVSYGGKTTTFEVAVTQHIPVLDDPAYGDLTYRDIFVTRNEVLIGDFEGNIPLTTSFIDVSNGKYRIYAGNPTISGEKSNSPSQSLKAFGTTSQQIQYRLDLNTSAKYLVAVSVNVSRYVKGYAGITCNPSLGGATDIDLKTAAVTDGFLPMAGVCTFANHSTSAYIGTLSSASVDAYVDDVVISSVPSGMTAEEAQSLYEEYIAIRKRGES